MLMQGDVEWARLCKAIQRPDIETDPRFENQDRREENNIALIKILDEIFATRDMAEWDERFRETNTIYGKVQTPNEVVDDPQALANNFFEDVPQPVLGKMKLVTTPLSFNPDNATLRHSAPEVGQHTEELLLELGYTWEDIAGFKDQRAIL